MVIFSLAPFSQVSPCVVAFTGGLPGNYSSSRRAFRGLGCGLCPSLHILKTVNAIRSMSVSLRARVATQTLAMVRLLHSKSIKEQDSGKKSVPNMQAA